MRAQVTLTSSESKKLLAKAAAATSLIKKAMEKGLIVIHPSSTTLFLVEELIGKRPEGVWVCGMILPKGTCISRETYEVAKSLRDIGIGQFPFSWVLDKGVFRRGLPLVSLLDEMGRGDIYVKGANAIDPEGKVGVLYAAPGAGTIGKVISARRRKGFTIIVPIGLEKLIPTPITKAAKVASRERTDVAMGQPVGLIPVPGRVISEIEAIDILSGAEAMVVAAGGLGGAEGSITLVIRGSEEKVNRGLQVIKDVKGAALPEIHPMDCTSCSYPACHLRGP
ncbi:MAG: hypothetical protein ACFFCW_18050 [Candidatus Hodarchaeota archaeon]